MRFLKYISIFLFFVCSQILGQQNITFSLVAENNKIEIGDYLKVSMRITYPAHFVPSELSFPILESNQSINDTIDIIEVLPIKTNATSDNQGNPLMVWQQDMIIGIYAGGNIALGPFEFIYGKDDVKDTILSNIATITVNTPEIQEDKEFVDIKSIQEDSFTFWEKVWLWLKTYWMWLLIPLVIIVGIIVLVYYINKKPQEEIIVEPNIPLPDLLLQRLQQIEQEKLWQEGKHKEYYSEVTDVIRRFLEYKYEIPTLEKTSDEIMQSLNLVNINKNDYNQLKNLFGLSNMIKFAKSLPSPEENTIAMSIAKGLITKEIKKQSK